MHVASILALALGLGASTAAATYQWNVTDFTLSCNGKCTYSFSVAGPFADNYDGFTANCSGKSARPFSSCDVTSTTVQPGSSDQITVFSKYVGKTLGKVVVQMHESISYTGNPMTLQGRAPLQDSSDFTITPKELKN